MGFAKAAELNRFPGPKHVLELLAELKLSPEQISQTQAIYEQMQGEAIRLGRQLVQKERLLDQKFATGQIDAKLLNSLVMEIGTLRAQIRNVHLAAHLKQKKVLSPHQVHEYDRMRGYSGGGDHHHHQQHSH